MKFSQGELQYATKVYDPKMKFPRVIPGEASREALRRLREQFGHLPDFSLLRCGASFDETGHYRYALWRIWDDRPIINFIGLNPSTADLTMDDPTIRRCIGFARTWGMGGIIMTNAFAFRSTDPEMLEFVDDPIGTGNDITLLEAAQQAERVVLAWGNYGEYRDRGKAVLNLLAPVDGKLSCFGYTKVRQPKHPLYLSKNALTMRLDLAMDLWREALEESR